MEGAPKTHPTTPDEAEAELLAQAGPSDVGLPTEKENAQYGPHTPEDSSDEQIIRIEEPVE